MKYCLLSGLKCTYTKAATNFVLLMLILKYILDSPFKIDYIVYFKKIDCNNINYAMINKGDAII